MKSAADTLEDRIRERAYHMWEASGRPSGRDEEFWHRASDALASDGQPVQPKASPRRRAAASKAPRKGKRQPD